MVDTRNYSKNSEMMTAGPSKELWASNFGKMADEAKQLVDNTMKDRALSHSTLINNSNTNKP
jgi:hypothetical protein